MTALKKGERSEIYEDGGGLGICNSAARSCKRERAAVWGQWARNERGGPFDLHLHSLNPPSKAPSTPTQLKSSGDSTAVAGLQEKKTEPQSPSWCGSGVVAVWKSRVPAFFKSACRHPALRCAVELPLFGAVAAG